MKKLLITILVIAAIAALALPKFLGSQGAKAHVDFFQGTAQQLMPGVIVESEKLEKGWFNSEGTHRVKLTEAFIKNSIPGVNSIDLDHDVDVVINTKFHHGPIAFSSFPSEGGSFSPVLAVAESTIQIDNNGKVIDLPGKVFAQVNPTGSSGKAKYVIESYSETTDDGAKIDFEGLEIDFDISDKGEVLDGKGKSGKLSIVGQNGEELVLDNLKFDTDMDKETGVWMGDSGFALDGLRFADGQGRSFGLKDIEVAGESKGNTKIMDNVGEFKIGEFNLMEMNFEDFKLDYSIENLDTQAMAGLQSASQESRQNPAAMLEHMKKIVERSPTFHINELSVETPEGKVQADVHLGLPDNVNMAFFPLSLLPQIEGDANIRIPKGVLRMLESVNPGLADQADFLAQMGMIEVKGNDYVAAINMQNGKLTVNGNDVPLPGLF